MPITITFHIFGFTVTIRINGRNRTLASDGFEFYLQLIN